MYEWVLRILWVLLLTYSLTWRRLYVDLLKRVFDYVTDFERRCYVRDGGSGAAQDEEEELDHSSPHCGFIIRSQSFTSKEFLLVPNGKQRSEKRNFFLADCMDYINAGVEAVIEDQVTNRFVAAKFNKPWNLLSRNNVSRKTLVVNIDVMWLNALWVLGIMVRYVVLFPFKLMALVLAVVFMVSSTFLVSLIPNANLRKWTYSQTSVMSFRFLASVFSSVITTHDTENMVQNGICVANHTSPIDAMVLGCDRAYTLVGQRDDRGVYGMIQRALGRAADHLLFERGEMRDRQVVARRLKDHVADSDQLPILIFPEGTCVNNTSVMQFKKGSFEIDSAIYPVAMKYDARFTDAFWNSSQEGPMQYIFMLMTSWALVCDVWYLPPMTRHQTESAAQFADRVKAAIAAKCGVVDLPWDGQLKRSKPKKELRERQQLEYSRHLIRELEAFRPESASAS